MKLEFLDLLDLTHGSELSICRIDVINPKSGKALEWIICGTVSIRSNRDGMVQSISSYIGGDARDEEHDPACAFSIPLIGLKYMGTNQGDSHFKAYIPGYSEGDFRIPNPGYDPFVSVCDYCEDPHPIVKYLPDNNPELFETLRGCELNIHFGPNYRAVDSTPEE